MFLGDGEGISQTICRASANFVTPFGWFLRNNDADHAHHLLAHQSQFIKKGHIDTEKIHVDHCLHDFLSQKDGIVQAGGIEDFIEYENAIRRGGLQYVMDPQKVILKFSKKVVALFFPFEMREECIKQEKSGTSCGDRAAQTGQEMQLSEASGEGIYHLESQFTHQDILTFVKFRELRCKVKDDRLCFLWNLN